MARGLPAWAIKQAGGNLSKAWSLFRAGKGTTRKSGGKKSLGGRKTTSRRSKLFRTISGLGAVEDLGVGLVGGFLWRALGQGANAVPVTRICQGIVAHGFNRRGKRHLVDGLIDYVDNWLLSLVMPLKPKRTLSLASAFAPVFTKADELTQVLKIEGLRA